MAPKNGVGLPLDEGDAREERLEARRLTLHLPGRGRHEGDEEGDWYRGIWRP